MACPHIRPPRTTTKPRRADEVGPAARPTALRRTWPPRSRHANNARTCPWQHGESRSSESRAIIRLVAGNVSDLMRRPVYGMPEVDALCGLPSGTARRWIDGYTRGGKHYAPVVRRESTGDELVTWGEFVETRLLAQYRDSSVPILHMRPVVEDLREQLNTDYPLAVARQWLEPEGHELVRQIQNAEKLPAGLRLVQELRTGQLALSPEVQRFVRQANTAADDLRSVVRLWPLAADREAATDVVLDPLKRSGAPTVHGVPTEVVLEQFRTGSQPSEIAEDFDLTVSQVLEALRFELDRHESTAA
jgi:uncharacterized protein (DUF433 family)